MIEAEQRKKNIRAGILIFAVIIIIDLLLAMAGIPIHWGPLMR